MVLVNNFCVLLKRPIFLLKSSVLRARVLKLLPTVANLRSHSEKSPSAARPAVSLKPKAMKSNPTTVTTTGESLLFSYQKCLLKLCFCVKLEPQSWSRQNPITKFPFQRITLTASPGHKTPEKKQREEQFSKIHFCIS